MRAPRVPAGSPSIHSRRAWAMVRERSGRGVEGVLIVMEGVAIDACWGRSRGRMFHFENFKDNPQAPRVLPRAVGFADVQHSSCLAITKTETATCRFHSRSTAARSRSMRPQHLLVSDSGAPPADGHARGLRHRAVRRVHDPRQRPRGQVLQCAGRPGGRRGHHHHRGSRSPTARCIRCRRPSRVPRPAVRPAPGMVMSAIDLCTHHLRGQRDRDPRAAGRQLPLHRLPEHRQGRADGRQGQRRRRRPAPATYGAPPWAHRLPQAAAHRRGTQAQGRLPLPHRRRPVHRRREPGPPVPRRVPASPHAHAAIKSIDTAAPRRCPAWWASSPARTSTARWAGPPCGWLINNPDGTPMKEPFRIPSSPSARCATWATTWPSWWPIRWSRPRTPPRRSRSTTRCCPRW